MGLCFYTSKAWDSCYFVKSIVKPLVCLISPHLEELAMFRLADVAE